MVHIQTFTTHEEMIAALQGRAAHALAGLHAAQAALTYGDHWVQFADLDNRQILFGRVFTQGEVAKSELDSGASIAETATVLTDTDGALRGGYLYGRAHDRFNSDGELGTTHKAHVWPIEERLYLWARDVDWEIERLDPAGRLLLDIAFRSMRAHVVGRR